VGVTEEKHQPSNPKKADERRGWHFEPRIKTILVVGKVRPRRPRKGLYPQTPTREGENEVFANQDLFSPGRNRESQTANDDNENELSTPATMDKASNWTPPGAKRNQLRSSETNFEEKHYVLNL
jgi:hypothetical protein